MAKIRVTAVENFLEACNYATILIFSIVLVLSAANQSTRWVGDWINSAAIGLALLWALCLILMVLASANSMRLLRNKGYAICFDCLYDLSRCEDCGTCPECGLKYNKEYLKSYWTAKYKYYKHD